MTNGKLSQRVWKFSEHEKELTPSSVREGVLLWAPQGNLGLLSNPTNQLSTSGVNSVLHFEGFGYSSKLFLPFVHFRNGVFRKSLQGSKTRKSQ